MVRMVGKEGALGGGRGGGQQAGQLNLCAEAINYLRRQI